MSTRTIVISALAALSFGAATANGAQLIVNGDFEAGGGSLAGWTIVDQAGGSGSWFLQSGTVSPFGFSVPAPPGPTNAAMTDQGGPGSHVLLQSFVVPLGVTAATLSFQYFIQNQNGAFFTPATLDYTAGANQQARVDIITFASDPFSVAAGDVLQNIYQTQVGDAATSGYDPISADVSALLAAHGGETLRLRFAEVDNQFFFQNGVDLVSLDAVSGVAVPEPATLALVLLGLSALGLKRRRIQT